MLILRPIDEGDLLPLMEMLESAGFGLTTLPKDPEVILKRIKNAQASFYSQEIKKPGGEDYLFIMEDIFTGKIAGISAIISKLGGFDPFYLYRVKTEARNSKDLNKTMELQTLHLEAEHNGPSEVCSLFLSPEYRNSNNGRFLSLARFLFIKENRHLFEDEIIAEMRGQVDDQGQSPFWKAVGKKFFDITFSEADHLFIKSKQFIKELLPNYPIIINLLPDEARAVIGKVHEKTKPARHILETEGLSFQGQVRIFEPGPILSAQVDEVRSIKDAEIREISKIGNIQNTIPFIIARMGRTKFKAAMGYIDLLDDGSVKISEVLSGALKLRIGDEVCFVELRKKKNGGE